MQTMLSAINNLAQLNIPYILIGKIKAIITRWVSHSLVWGPATRTSQEITNRWQVVWECLFCMTFHNKQMLLTQILITVARVVCLLKPILHGLYCPAYPSLTWLHDREEFVLNRTSVDTKTARRWSQFSIVLPTMVSLHMVSWQAGAASWFSLDKSVGWGTWLLRR